MIKKLNMLSVNLLRAGFVDVVALIKMDPTSVRYVAKAKLKQKIF